MRNTKDLNIKITPSIRDAYEAVYQKMYSNRRVLFEDMFRVFIDAKISELLSLIETSINESGALNAELNILSERFLCAKECDRLAISIKMGEMVFQIAAANEGVESCRQKLAVLFDAKDRIDANPPLAISGDAR